MGLCCVDSGPTPWAALAPGRFWNSCSRAPDMRAGWEILLCSLHETEPWALAGSSGTICLTQHSRNKKDSLCLLCDQGMFLKPSGQSRRSGGGGGGSTARRPTAVSHSVPLPSLGDALRTRFSPGVWFQIQFQEAGCSENSSTFLGPMRGAETSLQPRKWLSVYRDWKRDLAAAKRSRGPVADSQSSGSFLRGGSLSAFVCVWEMKHHNGLFLTSTPLSSTSFYLLANWKEKPRFGPQVLK